MARHDLFQLGEFTLASGRESNFKIECNSLTPGDWIALAELGASMVPPFSEVHGVPAGGHPFAFALEKHRQKRGEILVVDDVWTTGNSANEYIAKTFPPPRDVWVLVAFARSTPNRLRWRSIFTLNFDE